MFGTIGLGRFTHNISHSAGLIQFFSARGGRIVLCDGDIDRVVRVRRIGTIIAMAVFGRPPSLQLRGNSITVQLDVLLCSICRLGVQLLDGRRKRSSCRGQEGVSLGPDSP